MDFLTVSGISKQTGEAFSLKEVSLRQSKLQKLAIAGETGSGKTTLLKIIAGLEQPDSGEVFFEGKKVRGPDYQLIPGQEGIAYLSQYFELRNQYRMEELLSYANMLADEEAQTLYKLCRIDHLLKRKTDQLSGGEKQRIALARLLVSSPRLLILDEPFSNLDRIHKDILKAVIEDISRTRDLTCLMTSHDPMDVLPWADEVLIMRDGNIIQSGPPQEIYFRPGEEYTAALFGHYNLLTPKEAEAFGLLTAGRYKWPLIVRPGHFMVTEDERGKKGEITGLRYYGSYSELDIMIDNKPVTVISLSGKFKMRDQVYVSLPFFLD